MIKSEQSAIGRLLLDVTATETSDLQTGIQRVTIELYRWLVRLQAKHSSILAVCLTQSDGKWHHRLATNFVGRINGEPDTTPVGNTDKQSLVPQRGDILLHLDLATLPVYQASLQGLYKRYRDQGTKVASIVYDLLPVNLPDCFPEGEDTHHQNWLTALSQFDGALCISNDVAQDLRQWLHQNGHKANTLQIGAFKLGADIGTFRQSKELHATTRKSRFKRFGHSKSKTFLMVGTIEPRKAYAEVLDAFDRIWQLGLDYRLIIVGREGWPHLSYDQKPAIAEVISRLVNHPEGFRKLIWLSSADDLELENAYHQADCLIAASLGEGFGLPIIEATKRSVPVIARDIAVFREVAPLATVFFKDGQLVDCLLEWQPPTIATESLHNISWQESAQLALTWLGTLKGA